MTKLLRPALILASLLASGSAFADPVLKAEVDIAAQVVTVGDMFTDAGPLAGKPLFMSPAPGTQGSVPIADIRFAALKAGLVGFDDHGVTAVQVARLATPVDGPMLNDLLSTELVNRHLLGQGTTAQASFDSLPNGLLAAATDTPVQVVNFRYAQDTGQFAARFDVAGQPQPLDVTGRIDLMVEAPQLVATLPAGTILKDTDIVMQPMPLRLVQNGNIATVDQLVGKQLQRQSRAGMVLKVSDVGDPQLIGRNDLVTVYLHAGPLTLTIKGTALNAASLGEPVNVLNASSKKMVHGVARADGAVEVTAGPVSVAGL